MDRGNFFHAIYRIERTLGRAFSEIRDHSQGRRTRARRDPGGDQKPPAGTVAFSRLIMLHSGDGIQPSPFSSPIPLQWVVRPTFHGQPHPLGNRSVP
jgi:hypothetical protein